MSMSPSYPTLPNLFCNETTDEEGVSFSVETCKNYRFGSSDSLLDFDDGSVTAMFDSEVHQMLGGSKVIARFRSLPDMVPARQEAVLWMLKVHSYYMFRPETAYLSVNYLDRFLSAGALPQGKAWPMRLLSAACLSLAAKMEETSTPLLLDLQIIEPRFLFKPKTVQRMELLVMAELNWRLRTITPFDFVHYFIAKLPSFPSEENCFFNVSSRASQLIINTCKVIDFVDYPPSAIAAAVILCMTEEVDDDDQMMECLHKRVNKEMVKKCHDIIKEKLMCHSPSSKKRKLELVPPISPTTVLDAAIH